MFLWWINAGVVGEAGVTNKNQWGNWSIFLNIWDTVRCIFSKRPLCVKFHEKAGKLGKERANDVGFNPINYERPSEPLSRSIVI